jgi:putative ribosome biogenesis GTPase RsgA
MVSIVAVIGLSGVGKSWLISRFASAIENNVELRGDFVRT